ncbi:hypothetical protein KM1_005620 [Entamoeba histolytica HM-3:IMSS]|uniref:Uncharacterized protein n=2 Tax=Entamoeba histolytica TaxID=5759 RepID=M2RYK9_ENTHI|nr:Hypothetical protein EHI5A_007250 [Entamoeba histolytica KU27]EMS17654.1 hypothetical protein KM1_005620 [Entamoeba histolytica HM-3:IMSS]
MSLSPPEIPESYSVPEYFDDNILFIVSNPNNSSIQVQYDVGDKYNRYSWIGLFDINECDNRKYLKYKYINSSKGTIEFNSLCEGQYDIRYFPTNERNIAASSIVLGTPIQIKEVIQEGTVLKIEIENPRKRDIYLQLYKKGTKDRVNVLYEINKCSEWSNSTSFTINVKGLGGDYTLIPKYKTCYFTVWRYYGIFLIPMCCYISQGAKDIRL